MVGVFLLAAAGQAALERARTHGTPPPLFAAVEAANPGRPPGYRPVRRTVDRSIRRPVELPISVLEFERIL